MDESRSDILLFIVKLKKPKFHFSSVFLGVGIVFLYAPLLILVFFSFNESRLVTVWGGFSLKWYGELFQDSQILNAAWRSIRIAFSSATAALVLGTLAAYSLIKFPVFRGRRIFEVSITAPLVIPDVILGLSFFINICCDECSDRLSFIARSDDYIPFSYDPHYGIRYYHSRIQIA